jgi:dipeptidyl aminopeptidase/acylaminoacyl peptidase
MIAAMKAILTAALTLALASPALADDLAAKFGARPAVEQATLSPDGERIAWLAPTQGQGSSLATVLLEPAAEATTLTSVSGDPERLAGCTFVGATRLVCNLYGVIPGDPNVTGRRDVVDFSRLIALDTDGRNMKLVSKRERSDSRGVNTGGGAVLDYAPGQDGVVLIERYRLPNDQTGSLTGSRDEGLMVERVDTRTLRATGLVKAEPTAIGYLTDGNGTVRMKGLERMEGDGYQTGEITWLMRGPDGGEWTRFDRYQSRGNEGFWPLAIDRAANEVYGLREIDGRDALVARKLEAGSQERVVLARPDVEIDNVVTLGRQRRIIGATYATDRRYNVYFDAGLAKVAAGLEKALPGRRIEFVEESADGNRLLVWAGSDTDPGTFYLHDRTAKTLTPIFPTRPQLAGQKLATVRPITYKAADGTMVPAYLTLPPQGPQKGIPALVLPHGGPSARDEWGFDWLSQYFAAQGYAVIQPNFRGSAGYGDAWFRDNGFIKWDVAIGDVLDAGRHLVREGIADPAKLAIVGWSYGGYAALQSAVVDPGLFKAVVAIAPVTDLGKLKAEYRFFSNQRLVSDFIGNGPHIEEGSPARHAARITAPVLLFHGAMDVNVDIGQSKLMADRLAAAGRPAQLVTWDRLDHYLEDSAARTKLLSMSHQFLSQQLGK